MVSDMSRPIAIIGAAGLFPEASSLDDFHRNLAEGRDSVRPLPEDRLRYATLDPSVDYPEVGCLDRIDLFDHGFFTISLREAELMDPHQRLSLQLVCAAIENAGYALGSLRGTRTAVMLSAPRSEYSRLIRIPDPLELLGTEPAALAGRIAYALDLQGPALVIDAGCAASLVAVHQACRELHTGEVEVAIAGGLSVAPVIGPREGHDVYAEIMSPDGRCKAFDASANGAGLGEGGAFLVLKTLDRALEDGDNVQAVITGSSFSQSGARSNGLAAPSPSAQSQTILDAWARAGLDPATLGYVEAHGSGTRLGDVIEVQGLSRAFAEHGVAPNSCPIGSVKTNVGHLDHAAGIAGLVRALLSVRHGVLYPSLHFREPNPLIDFESSAVYVNTASQPWPARTEGRRAAVSSFSLAGTNVHMVIEAMPSVPAPSRNGGGREVITLSARTRPALDRYRDNVAAWISRGDVKLAEAAHLMNRGRDDHPWRLAVTADSTGVADALLGASLPDLPTPAGRPIVLLFSGDASVADAELTALATRFPAAADALGEVSKLAGRELTPGQRVLCLHYCLLRVLRDLGITESSAIGSGPGNLAVRIARDGMALEQATADAAEMAPTAELDPERLSAALDRLGRALPLYVEMGPRPDNDRGSGVLTRHIAALGSDLEVVSLLAGEPLDAFAALYRAGATVDWERHYDGRTHRRVSGPTYPFEEVRCWCREVGDDYHLEDDDHRPAPVVAERSSAIGIAELATSVEEAVGRIWAEALKITQVDSSSDYFALGGTSITGMTVLDGVERDLGVRLNYVDLYDHPTLGGLAQHVESLRAAGPAAAETHIVAVPRTGELPLSFGQEQIWFLDQLNPDSALYSIPMDLHFKGDLDTPTLGAALADLARRHEVLRTRFPSREGRPYAVVDEEPRVDLALVDLSSVAAHDRTEQAERVFTREATKPFDLAAGPLARATLVRLAPDDHVLILVLHHIIYDGWTPFVIHRELSELYRAQLEGDKPDLNPLTIQYADFAAWQRKYLTGEVLERDLAYWRQHLRGAATLELPTDRPRPPVQNFAGDLVEFDIPDDVSRQLRMLGRGEGVTTFATMLAAVDAFMARITGQDDIVIGSPTSGRRRAETRQLIGYFNNMMPLRTDVSGDPTFRDLLHRTGAVVARGLDHDEAPLEKIVSDLSPPRHASRHPFFDVAYSHQNAPIAAYDLPGLEMVGYFGGGSVRGIAPGTSKFDLTIGVADQDDGAMEGYFEFAIDLFDRSTIDRMVDNFLTLLRSIASNPDQRVSELEVVAPEERALLDGFATAQADYPTSPLVHELVAQQAVLQPHAIAVTDPTVRLTYGELDQRANRMARHLAAAGAGPDDVVVLFLPRSADVVVAALAVLRTGAAYASVDPAYPDARVAHILGDAGAAAVVTTATLAARLPGDIPVIRLDEDAPAIAAHSADAIPGRAAPGNLAYLIYTSGSTGAPKGVQIEHANLLNLVHWHLEEFAVTPSDRVSQIAGVGFDASVWELWPYLCRGASVHVPEPDTRLDPVALREWLGAERITLAFLPTPVAEGLLADGQWPSSLALRIMFCGGDKLLRRPPSGLSFDVVDLYGPSECTVISTFSTVSPHGQGVPDIGRPMANAQVRVLDRDLNQLPIGAWGELCVGGAVVGRGYRGRPDTTAERFVPDSIADAGGARLYRTGDRARWRAGGHLEFGGRTDHMVKVRAFRIELGEIEGALASHPAVREAIVLARNTPSGQKRLVAYVVPVGTAGLDDVETHLRRVLPDYMIPERFVVLDRFPLTPNGKVDRDALPDPDSAGAITADTGGARQEARLPADPLEALLAGIWADVLGVDSVRPQDNFFDLGGDSILSIQIVARAARAGVRLTPRQLFQHQTVAALAQAVRPQAGLATGVTTAPATPGALPLTPVQRGMLFHSLLDPDCYVEQVRIPLRGRVDADAMERAWRTVSRANEVLRTSVIWQGTDEPVQVVHDAAEASFTHLDWRDVPEADVDSRLLEAMADDVARGFDLSRAPLARVALVEGPAARWELIVTHHHVILDGWSAALLLGDLLQVYDSTVSGASAALPVRRPFRDYVQWVLGRADDGRDHWRSVLSGFTDPTPLPGSPPTQPRIGDYREVRAVIGRQETSSLREVARRSRVTLNTTVQAAWAWMSARCAGVDDIVFGVTASARPPELDGADEIVGLMITTLPLRARIPAGGEVTVWLAEIQEQSAALLQYSAFDPAATRALTDVAPERPLFESIVAFESFPQEAIPLGALHDVEVQEPETVDRSSYPLALAVGDGADLDLVLHYDGGSLDDETARLVLDHVVDTLRAIGDGDEIGDLPLPPASLRSRRPLPETATTSNRAPSGYAPPATPAEHTLCAIVADVLGVDRVGIHDRFFDLGGDSIASMRIVARAERQSLRVTARQIYELETVAALARGAVAVDSVAPGPRSVAVDFGPVELLPVQRWFLDQHPAELNHFNLALLLDTPDNLNDRALAEAAQAVVARHAALRLRIRRNAFGWWAECAEREEAVIYEVSSAADDEHVAAEAAAVQASLDLENGPVVRLRAFPRARRLLLVVHHMASDAVSLGLLVDDLRAAYDDAVTGVPPSPALGGTSMAEWGARLADYARSDELAAELPYWRDVVDGADASIPLDAPDGDPTEGAAEVVTIDVGARQTRDLVDAVASSYRMRTHEVVAAALARALAHWCEREEAFFDIEGHGREELWDGAELSRTIGWFTTLHPARIGAVAGDPGTWLKAAKEALRRVPAGGLGYGVLRHLSPATPPVEHLRAAPSAAVSFNFLGALDASLSAPMGAGGAGGFTQVDADRGPDRGAGNVRPHPLVVQAQLVEGRLVIDLEFDGRLARPTVEGLGRAVEDALREATEHCRAGEWGATPSDFPLAALDQPALDRVLATGEVEDVYRLSPVQEAMLFHSLLDPAGAVYTEQIALAIEGRLDIQAFRDGWAAVARAHPVLRTAVLWEDVPHPVQVVHRNVEVQLEVLDWRAVVDADTALTQHLDLSRQIGVLRDQPPLWRLSLARVGDESWLLVWTHHHVLLDGWSAAIVLDEVLDAYAAAQAGEPPDIAPHRPYRDYIAWLRRVDPDRARRYWRDQLAGVSGPTPLGVDRPDPARTGYGSAERVLSPEATARVDEFARKQRVTPSTLVQAAWAFLLSRYARQSDVVFGVTVSGRPSDLDDVESMVGCFINTLPLRVDVDPQASVGDWLARIQDLGLSARRFEHTSLVGLRELTELPPGAPLFESIVVFENYPIRNSDTEVGLEVRFHEAVERTNFPLTIVAGRGEGLDLRVYWDRPRIPDDAAERLLAQLESLLIAMADRPTGRVGDLHAVDRAERDRLAAAGTRELEAPAHTTIPDAVEAQVARTPDQAAVVSGAEQLSFLELDGRANRLAHHLVALGAGPEVVCAVACGRSTDLVVAQLAVVKAGAAYLPLDLEAPADRIRFVIEDAGVRVVVLQDDLAPALLGGVDPPAGVDVVRLAADQAVIERLPTTPPFRSIESDNLAYVMYTSGSTGVPKGVAITHGNVCRLVFGLGDIELAGRRLLHASSDAFDASTFEIWGPLAHGGSCVMHPPAPISPASLRRAIRDHHIDVAWLTSSLFNVVVDDEPAALEGLSVLLVGGEALSVPHIRKARELHPTVRLLNGYGPTEVTTFTTTHEVGGTEEEWSVPIGTPIGGTGVHVVDERGGYAPLGVAGELWVGGRGVARGYLNRPDLTAERFVPDPFSGAPGRRLYRTGDLVRWLDRDTGPVLEFTGRIDGQVKIRGFRVEVSEVEVVLAEHPAVDEAVVVGLGEGARRSLAAYVVCSGERPSASSLRDHLGTRLPDYMVPADIVYLDALPLNRSGKLDRSALPEPERTRDALETPYVSPTMPVEEVVASVFASVLGVERVGRDDNFFELGGNSLLATQVTSRLRRVFGVPVELREVFEARSVGAVAAHIVAHCGTEAVADEIARMALEIARLPDEEVRRLLAEVDSSD